MPRFLLRKVALKKLAQPHYPQLPLEYHHLVSINSFWCCPVAIPTLSITMGQGHSLPLSCAAEQLRLLTREIPSLKGVCSAMAAQLKHDSTEAGEDTGLAFQKVYSPNY